MSHTTQQVVPVDSAVFSRATVAAVVSDGVVVTVPGREPRTCDLVSMGTPGPELEEGDVVFVWLPSSLEERGIILGCVSAFSDPSREREADEIVIEAKKNLILKCGDGSITIREDGKILIKGKDLVSHAKRTNRIKGGSVQIN